MLCQLENLITTVFFKKHMVFYLRLFKCLCRDVKKKEKIAKGDILIPIYTFVMYFKYAKNMHTHIHMTY